MPKDYAKKMISARRHKPKKEPRLVPVVAAVLAAFCLIGATVYAIHVYSQSAFFAKEHVAAWMDSAKAMVSRKAKSSVKMVKSQIPPPADEIQFDFYTELPNMQVNLPESATLKPLSIVATVPKSGNRIMQIDESIKAVMARQAAYSVQKQALQFVVQLGEFKDPVGASQLRLSLLLAGVETTIVKTSEHTYRVQQGPWSSERQAKSAQRLLGKKGFEGSVKVIS